MQSIISVTVPRTIIFLILRLLVFLVPLLILVTAGTVIITIHTQKG
ncbi:MAG: hypothetical protein AAB381_02395 [Patescibacteria group bacterium]